MWTIEFEKVRKIQFFTFTFGFGLSVITLEPFEVETSYLVCGYLLWMSKNWREIVGFLLPVSTFANISRLVRRRTFIFGMWVQYRVDNSKNSKFLFLLPVLDFWS